MLCHYNGAGALLGAWSCELRLIWHHLPPSPLFWICSFERTCTGAVLDLLQGKELRVGFWGCIESGHCNSRQDWIPHPDVLQKSAEGIEKKGVDFFLVRWEFGRV